MDKVILKIHIMITDVKEVETNDAVIKMISFGGFCKSKCFKGKILDNAIDTQKIFADGTVELSARYILEGTDYAKNDCRIFIENNVVCKNGEKIVTKPHIYTDSRQLQFLTNGEIYGEIVNEDKQLVILIKEGESK